MESEQGRLVRLYGELGEEHLRDLAKDPEDLTDEARMALAAEMQRRGLVTSPERGLAEDGLRDEPEGGVPEEAGSEPERAYAFGAGVPGIVPAGGPGVEQALEPGGEERQGMVSLASFFDGLELSRACAALEDVDVEPAIQEIAGDAAVGAASRFEIWVDAADVEVSREILHTKLGLFPTADEEEPLASAGEREHDGHDGRDGGEVVVGEFESRGEAEQVRAHLQEHGIGARVDEEDASGQAEGVKAAVVMVAAGEQERALRVLQDALELG